MVGSHMSQSDSLENHPPLCHTSKQPTPKLAGMKMSAEDYFKLSTMLMSLCQCATHSVGAMKAKSAGVFGTNVTWQGKP